jgi:CMP-N,N'-diacetyllegionaminic acid synthase
MYGVNKVLGVSFARANSKGLPGKNLRPLFGKPLVVHTIEAAMASRYLDRCVMSTDSPRMAEVAAASGASVPFLRPAHLAGDSSPALAAIKHAVQWLAEHEGARYDAVVSLQPTTPTRTPGQIDEAIALFFDEDADAVLGVVPAEHSPYWMFRIVDGRLEPLMDAEAGLTSRQSLPPVYRSTGSIYVNRAEDLLSPDTPDNVPLWELGTRVVPLVLDDPLAGIDIDTEAEFATLELLMANEMRVRSA